MKGRLFWKILFAFWLTFLAMTHGVWLLFEMTRDRRPPPERPMAQAVAPVLLTLAADAVARSGRRGFDDLLAHIPADQGKRLDLMPGPVPARGADEHKIVRDARGPDGHFYQVRYWYRQPPRRAFLPSAPPELLIVGLIGGLCFAGALAWYLTVPISRVRGGFDRLAKGDLSVRLTGSMGARRDEVADLARDFDQMAQRLEQLVAARDRLLHDVSHELRSPLARLQLAIGLARQSPARLETSLDRIDKEVRKLDGLVGELLALARAEHGVTGAEQYFDLAEVVRSAVEDASFEAQASGIHIVLAEQLPVEDERIALIGDAELVRRAIENVLRNALRFSASGQHVEVKIHFAPEARCYEIEIADRGPGVPAGVLTSIFDPFVRGDGDGLGLGLAIASRAVAAHGGTMTARNRDSGGLSIAVSLPVRQA